MQLRGNDSEMSGHRAHYRAVLATYLRGHVPGLGLLALLLGGNVALQLTNPLIVRRFLDAAAAGADLASLGRIAVLFLGVVLLTQAVAVAETYIAEDLGWRATNALRADLVAHCLDLDLGFHQTHLPGELVERVDEDTATLANFFSRFTIQILTSALLLLGTMVVLATIDWRMALGFAAFVALTLLLLVQLRSRTTPYFRRGLETFESLYGFIGEWLAGTEDLRSRGAVPYVLNGLSQKLRDRLWANRDIIVVLSLFLWAPIGLATTLAIALAYVLGDDLYRSGAITLGTVYALTAYAALVSQPLVQLTGQLQDFQRATAGLGRIGELLGTASRIRPGPRQQLPPGPLAVQFADVTFAYPNGSMVLCGVSFELAPGRVLGVVGRTGSGKTTLARLVLRFYDPTSGVVRLGDVDLRDLREDAIRARVSLVTQDVQLFHGTIRDNLCIFDPSIPDDAILRVIDDLGLGDWYAALPSGLDTEIFGEAGLSAGQAQLLAFGRTFLRDPSVVILDEATARLDPATERQLERAVDRLLAGRTAIVIAHRLATVTRADEILILDGGGVGERGERVVLAADPTSRFAALLRSGLEVVPA